METQIVICEVETEFVYILYINFAHYGVTYFHAALYIIL